MGQSTNAILVYGIALAIEDEEYPEGWGTDDDERKTTPASLFGWGDETDDGVTIVSHCSSEYPMFVLAIGSTKRLAYRGSPAAVGPMLVPEGSDAALAAFASKFGLPIDVSVNGGAPGWILCSDWC